MDYLDFNWIYNSSIDLCYMNLIAFNWFYIIVIYCFDISLIDSIWIYMCWSRYPSIIFQLLHTIVGLTYIHWFFLDDLL